MVRFSFNCFSHSAHLELAPTLPAQIQAAAGAGYDHVGLDVPFSSNRICDGADQRTAMAR
jgi:hypothetical protein